MKWRPFICFILVPLALGAGCVPLQYKGSPYEGAYGGLRDRWNERTNNSTLRVIMVHGMGGLGNTVPGYGDTFATNVANLLHLSGELDNITNPLPSSAGVTNFLRTFRFTNRRNDQLKFYEVTWSPTTTQIKAGQFSKDDEMNTNGNRLPFNIDLKQVIDLGFGDATLYLNPDYRPYMQQPILQTIAQVDAEMSNDDDQVVFVTHSLGSKMAFDTMIDNETNPAVTNVLEKTTDIIMLANQLPLLDLGIETNVLARAVGNSGLPSASTLTKFMNVLGRHKRRRPHPSDDSPDVRVVAATDPNDALSYPLKPGLVSSGSIQFSYSDIYRYNDQGIFDLFLTSPPYLENPVTAHTGYWQNIDLIKKLLNGFP